MPCSGRRLWLLWNKGNPLSNSLPPLSTATSFNPSVVINGESYDTPGWMYVIAFAIRGVPWALETAHSAEFQARMDAIIKGWKIARLDTQIQELKEQLACIEKLRKELK